MKFYFNAGRQIQRNRQNYNRTTGNGQAIVDHGQNPETGSTPEIRKGKIQKAYTSQ